MVENDVKYVKASFHYGVGANKEKAIGEAELKAGKAISFVCVDSFTRVAYKPLEEQTDGFEISNDTMEYSEVVVKQDASNFEMKAGLEPGTSISIGRPNKSKSKVAKVKRKIDILDNYEVTISKEAAGGKFVKSVAEVNHGQILRIEGVDI